MKNETKHIIYLSIILVIIILVSVYLVYSQPKETKIEHRKKVIEKYMSMDSIKIRNGWITIDNNTTFGEIKHLYSWAKGYPYADNVIMQYSDEFCGCKLK